MKVELSIETIKQRHSQRTWEMRKITETAFVETYYIFSRIYRQNEYYIDRVKIPLQHCYGQQIKAKH